MINYLNAARAMVGEPERTQRRKKRRTPNARAALLNSYKWYVLLKTN